MNGKSFDAICPNCRAKLKMLPHGSDFTRSDGTGSEWVGKCSGGHYIQLRTSLMAPPQEGDVDFEPPAVSIRPPAVSIRNSRLARKKKRPNDLNARTEGG